MVRSTTRDSGGQGSNPALLSSCHGHVTTQSMSPQYLRSPMLTFATKKLSTGSNSSNLKGQKEDAASFFCQRNLIELSWQLRVMYVIPSWDNISLHVITSLRSKKKCYPPCVEGSYKYEIAFVCLFSVVLT